MPRLRAEKHSWVNIGGWLWSKPSAVLFRLWDEGTYEAEEWTDRAIRFTLHGARASGKFNLIRFSHGKPNERLIIKRPDNQAS
jgi:hypothetical protein